MKKQLSTLFCITLYNHDFWSISYYAEIFVLTILRHMLLCVNLILLVIGILFVTISYNLNNITSFMLLCANVSKFNSAFYWYIVCHDTL